LPESSPSSDPTTAYARSVVDGTFPAGQWHRKACARHLADLGVVDSPWVFRADLAAKSLGIFGLYRHYKGEWAGERIKLEPWQQFIVGSLMGWVSKETGRRRFRNAFIELPRGNGKSTLAGGLLVLFAFFLDEGGAEAYSVATKKDQARISFQAGRQMLLRSPALSKHVDIGKYNVHNPTTESKMEALGADADTLDGLRPFIVVVDEVHKLPSGDLVEVMESGMGTRMDPLMFEITTAGKDDHSVYGQHHLLSTRVLDGTVDLPQWFGFIAAADPDDDWTQESTWKKANPNYGVSVKPDFMRNECQKALANPAEQAKYRRLYLGQKVEAVEAYFSVPDWRACPPLPAETDLLAHPCWMGFDLSSTTDLTAAVLVWQLPGDEWAVRPILWMPEDTIVERGHEDRMPYDQLRRDGWLRVTTGRTIDRQQIRRQLVELAKKWKPKAICADPWQMHELGPQLAEEDKIPVILVPQRFEKLSEPMKIAQARIIERRIRHDHNPLMTVMIGNVTPREDENGNVRTSKRKSRGRIDGVQAMLNAVAEIPIIKPVAPSFFVAGGRKA
jgi:phage terminase large subunit-like protein